RRGVPEAVQVTGESGKRLPLLLGERGRPGAVERCKLALFALDGDECLLVGALKRARDEPVLGLAGVVLALRARGLVLGPLKRELLLSEPLGVSGLELGRRLGAGTKPGRGHRLEEGVGDGAVEPGAAQRLTGAIGAVQVTATHAGVARRAAVAARVGDLHPPAAAAAAKQTLQQGGALTGGTAALATRPRVRPQPLARGQVVLPADIAGMMLGQADSPLLERHVDALHPDTTVRADPLLLARAPVDEGAGVGGVGEEVVDGAVGRPHPADTPLADPATRQLLAPVDQIGHHLAGRAEPVPEREDVL